MVFLLFNNKVILYLDITSITYYEVKIPFAGMCVYNVLNFHAYISMFLLLLCFFFIKMFISWYIKFNFVYNSYYIAEVQHVNNIIFLECYVLFIMGYKLTEVKLNMSRFGWHTFSTGINRVIIMFVFCDKNIGKIIFSINSFRI